MPGTRWIKVEATIVECFRAGEERPAAAHRWYEIVADIKTPAGKVERVRSKQKLNALTHHWRAPEPGDVVSARWNHAHRELRLDLRRDPRYDERLIRALGRTRDASPGPPNQTGAAGPTKNDPDPVAARFGIGLPASASARA
jgi:hypothetical protein